MENVVLGSLTIQKLEVNKLTATTTNVINKNPKNLFKIIP